MALSRLLGFLFGWSPEPTSDLPVLYTWKIDRISSISKFGMSHCASRDFSAGGYTWKLFLRRPGTKTNDGKNCMSLNLHMVKAWSLPPDLEVKAVFELCIQNQVGSEHIREKAEYCFQMNRREWGPYNLSFEAFDSASGFLVNDSCIFSIEIINVIVRRIIVENLLLKEEPKTDKYTYKVDKFSKLRNQYHISQYFVAGGNMWYLGFHPGRKCRNAYYISLNLHMHNYKILPANIGVLVHRVFRMIDQMNGNNRQVEDYFRFDSNHLSHGYSTFLPLDDLYNPSKGFLLNDTCIIEASLRVVGVASFMV
uniref:Ubiquitin carboxyl-terminal hydrolase 12 n=1 Tax=Anthurium amnicola TaxID=1678845 RepID=A0A1D1YFY7_9ARAE